jgi:hypothetical protein
VVAVALEQQDRPHHYIMVVLAVWVLLLQLLVFQLIMLVVAVADVDKVVDQLVQVAMVVEDLDS